MESNATTIKPSKWAEHDEVSSEEGSLKDEDIVKPTARVKAREPPSSTASASTSRPSSSQPPAYERRPDRAPPVPPVHDQSGSEGAGMMVMLGNLNFACTDDELYRFFSEEGGCRIASLRLGKGQNSRNNGTAFIELQDQESVGFALSAKGITFQGRSLRVEVSRGGRINDRGDQGGAERGGDRRERDNRYPAAAERDNGIQWDRKERPPAPLPPKESSRPRVPDRSVPAEVPKLEPVVPATRPKLELKPRTVPVDAELPVTKPESIFGTGKPRVEPPKVCNIRAVLLMTA
jgi:RNA recognition motif-containing protein